MNLLPMALCSCASERVRPGAHWIGGLRAAEPLFELLFSPLRLSEWPPCATLATLGMFATERRIPAPGRAPVFRCRIKKGTAVLSSKDPAKGLGTVARVMTQDLHLQITLPRHDRIWAVAQADRQRRRAGYLAVCFPCSILSFNNLKLRPPGQQLPQSLSFPPLRWLQAVSVSHLQVGGCQAMCLI
jgi:hypothetical protein